MQNIRRFTASLSSLSSGVMGLEVKGRNITFPHELYFSKRNSAKTNVTPVSFLPLTQSFPRFLF